MRALRAAVVCCVHFFSILGDDQRNMTPFGRQRGTYCRINCSLTTGHMAQEAAEEISVMHIYICVGRAGPARTAVFFWASSNETIEQNLEAEKKVSEWCFGVKTNETRWRQNKYVGLRKIVGTETTVL